MATASQDARTPPASSQSLANHQRNPVPRPDSRPRTPSVWQGPSGGQPSLSVPSPEQSPSSNKPSASHSNLVAPAEKLGPARSTVGSSAPPSPSPSPSLSLFADDSDSDTARRSPTMPALALEKYLQRPERHERIALGMSASSSREGDGGLLMADDATDSAPSSPISLSLDARFEAREDGDPFVRPGGPRPRPAPRCVYSFI